MCDCVVYSAPVDSMRFQIPGGTLRKQEPKGLSARLSWCPLVFSILLAMGSTSNHLQHLAGDQPRLLIYVMG
jgi:hypothetical protein